MDWNMTENMLAVTAVVSAILATIGFLMFSIASILFIIFVVLKVMGIIVFSWWLVTLPLWIVPAIIIAFAFIFFSIGITLDLISNAMNYLFHKDGKV